MHLPLYDKLNLIRMMYLRIKGVVLYRHIFGAFGDKSWIASPELIANPRYMRIGDSVSIRKGVRLECIEDMYGRTPTLRIGSNVNIEQDVHIVCHNRITIGNNVSITGRCAIVDVTHPYRGEDTEKIGSRIADEDSFVEICDGAFLGIGTIILPNVRIGKGAVIGANSVVNRDVPDYAVAAGAPARVTRIYRHDGNEVLPVIDSIVRTEAS